MENGTYYGLDQKDYFAAVRINASGLKLINKSPLHYITDKYTQREETKAMMIGSAVHCAVLEAETFDSRYVVAPAIDKRTKAGKAMFEEFQETGKIVLSVSDMEMIAGISNSVLGNENAAKLLNKGNPEVTLFTDIDGIKSKCRMDWYRPGIIVDLKTCEDASPEGFARSCANYGYAIQAAWYLDCANASGLDTHTFCFIAVEKSPPFAMAIYTLDDESIEYGRQQYKHALNQYRNCIKTNFWPGYTPDIKQISLPKWAMKNTEEYA